MRCCKTEANKILYICVTSEIGGAEKSILTSLINLPDELRGRVFVCVPGNGPFIDLLVANKIKVVNFKYSYKLVFSNYFVIFNRKIPNIFSICFNFMHFLVLVYRVVKKTEEINPAIVHLNNFEFNLVLPFPLKTFTKTKVVCHVREIYIQQRKLFPLLQYVFRKYVDKVLVVSEAVKNIFSDKVVLNKVNVLYNSIDLKLYQIKKGANAIKVSLGFKEDSFLILAAGRITPWKGYEILLKAVSSLKHEDFCICIAGDSSIGKDEYLVSLEKMTIDLQLGSRVNFIGFVKDIGSYINASDLIVHSPIEDEPLGRFILESMAFGRAVIASRNGGTCEIIEDGFNGLVFTPGKSEELALKIKSLYEDLAFRKNIGINAKKTVDEKFSPMIHSEKLVRIYNEILSH